MTHLLLTPLPTVVSYPLPLLLFMLAKKKKKKTNEPTPVLGQLFPQTPVCVLSSVQLSLEAFYKTTGI